MSRSPRILYVSPFWPDQNGTGSERRSLNLLQALQQVGTVEMVTLDQEPPQSARAEADCPAKVAFSLPVKPQPRNGLLEQLKWTFDPRSDYPLGFGVGNAATARLFDSLRDFDLIWFFKLRCPDLFLNAAWPRSVVDIDDVPSTFERSALQVGAGLSQRALTYRRLFTWRRREKRLGERFTVLTVCSEEDKEYLHRMGVAAPVHVIPNGFKRPLAEPVRNPSQPPRLGFIGLFEHLPNRDGIEWFVDQCWPRIKREVPDARLRLIGSGSDAPLRSHGSDIDALGWVPDPSEEIKTWSSMIIPIRLGAGTRVKIAQAFSEKCPIVSTAIGAYGYRPRDGHDMWLGDTPDAFSKACIKAIREPEQAAEMAERAWRQFMEKWTWDAIRPLVWAAAEDCLRLAKT